MRLKIPSGDLGDSRPPPDVSTSVKSKPVLCGVRDQAPREARVDAPERPIGPYLNPRAPSNECVLVVRLPQAKFLGRWIARA
jgi:hypothetical protein